MSTSGSKSNEHVAHFLVDIHIVGQALCHALSISAVLNDPGDRL